MQKQCAMSAHNNVNVTLCEGFLWGIKKKKNPNDRLQLTYFSLTYFCILFVFVRVGGGEDKLDETSRIMWVSVVTFSNH